MLTPQIKQSLFAARPAAVNIIGRLCESESEKEDEINDQPCSFRSIRKLHKPPPKRKNSRSPNARPTPTTKEIEGLTPVTVGLPIIRGSVNK